MSDFYYDDHRRGRSSFNTTDDYYRRPSFPRPPYNDYTSSHASHPSSPAPNSVHYNHSNPDSRRNSNRDLVAYNPSLEREYTNTHAQSRSRSRPRQRSLSPPHLRRDSDSSYSDRSLSHHHHHHEHEHEHERGHGHDHHHHHHDDGHHGHHHHDEHRSEHHGAKNAAATVLGGIVGEQAAKRAHGNHLAEAAGVLIGAWGGHELEKGWEKRERR